MRITLATDPGSPGGPNEDWAVTNPDLVVVLDGATVRTDTGCIHGAAWYARALGSALASTTMPQPLAVHLGDAIDEVRRRHPVCDLDHPGTPSAGVAIVQRIGSRVRWLALGDVTVVLDTADGVRVVTDQRISSSAAAERAEADRYPIGSPEKDAAMVAMKHAELAARGRDYWVAAADRGAAAYALTGDLPADEVHRFAVLSDGAARWVDLYHAGDWSAALQVLGDVGPEWFIEHLVRGIEAHDPTGVRYPRNKCSDDATVVLAELERPRYDPLTVSPTAMDAAQGELRHRLNDPNLYGDGMLIKNR